MPYYRKKPSVIEAVRWTGPTETNVENLQSWGVKLEPAGEWGKDFTLLIVTLEGKMRCEVGDWIIKGVKGEFYSCKDDIFRQLHSPCNGKAVHHMMKYNNDMTLYDPEEPVILLHPALVAELACSVTDA